MKEVKDLKETKEKEKEVKDTAKDTKEHEELQDVDPIQPAARSLGSRLVRLEETVASLVHFIQASERPDLRRSALRGEADYAAQLTKQARDAKALKDAKDVEKGRES
jgi:hypothetical protein